MMAQNGFRVKNRQNEERVLPCQAKGAEVTAAATGMLLSEMPPGQDA